MASDAWPHDIRVDCGAPGLSDASRGRLGLSLGGRPIQVRLNIAQLSRKIVANLPDVAADLLEVAAYVYAADTAVSRGRLTDPHLGRKWRRRFCFDIAVRRPDVWSAAAVQDALSTMLGFLSDDIYKFQFREHPAPEPREKYFDFGPDQGFTPESVVLFSGGLDSLAGALEEALERRNPVCLVSHRSSTAVAKVQSDLIRLLEARVGRDNVLHVPVTAQVGETDHLEWTHRSRSFLFAALGAATAQAFDRSRVTFYENGVVSLNLPPVGQVIGSRATRTTHPQALAGFTRLFALVFGRPVRVENTFFLRTKTEVVQLIERLGCADLIAATRSCAEVRGRTRMHPHCGRCSQCIDRRFAMFAAGLEGADPAADYEVDLWNGPRPDVRDREIALAYVRNARWFRSASEREYLGRFGEISRAVEHLGQPVEAAMRLMVDVHRRHGVAVTQVAEAAMGARAGQEPHPDSLLALYREASIALVDSPARPNQPAPPPPAERILIVRLDRVRRRAVLEGLGAISGANFSVLDALAEAHLAALGRGLQPEDFPTSAAGVLAVKWDLDGEEAVRRRILRLRRALERLFRDAGDPVPGDQEVIENIPWHGYQLNPDHVRVYVEPGPQVKPEPTARRGRTPPREKSVPGGRAPS